MNATTYRSFLGTTVITLALGLLAACAEARPAGSPAETDLAVTDESGGSVPGDYELWSPKSKDTCSTSGSSCAVSLGEGDYYMTFKKLRGGRLAQSGGGNAGGNRASGCLRARVHLVPGKEIRCKKVAEYNCSRQATETMDCGAAASSKYGAPGKPPAPMELPPDSQ